MRHVEAHQADSRNLSEAGVKQLILAYRADKNGATVKDWKPRPGFMYTTVRAISARVNQNYDAWPSEELKKSYRTFLGKPVFVNHNNFDPTRARGRVIAARYVEAGDDKYIEVIQEVDAQRFPKLAHELRTGGLDGVSMGVEAGFTKCSICGNKATDTDDMCNHVKYRKGDYLPNYKTGKKTLCYENCYKLGFFELSYVFDPADETAVVSKVLVANRQAAATPADPSLQPGPPIPDAPSIQAPQGTMPPPWAQIKPPATGFPSYVPPTDPTRQHEFVQPLKQEASRKESDRLHHTDWHEVGRNAYATGESPNPSDHHEVRRATRHLPQHSPEIHKVYAEYQSGYQKALREDMSRAAGLVRSAADNTPTGGQVTIPLAEHAGPSMTMQLPRPGWADWKAQQETGTGAFNESIPGHVGDPTNNGSGPGNFNPGIQIDTSTADYTPGPYVVPPNTGIGPLDKPDLGPLGFPPGTTSFPKSPGMEHAPEVVNPWGDPAPDVPSQYNPSSPKGEHSFPVTTPGGTSTPRTPLASKGNSLERDLRRLAFGEIEAPEDVDTLRPEQEDVESPFKHYVESSEELRDPNIERSIKLQEKMGEGVQQPDEPEMVHLGRSRMTQRVSRRFYAEDDSDDDDAGYEEESDSGDGGDESYSEEPDSGDFPPEDESGAEEDGGASALEEVIADFLQWCEQNGVDPASGLDDYAAQTGLDDETYQGLQYFVDQFFGGGEQSEEPVPTGPPGGGAMDANDMGNGPPVALASRRRTKKGKNMGRSSLAERGRMASRGRKRHFTADDGTVDTGDQHRNDQGKQEEVFISQTPGTEAVAAPTPGDDTISNTEKNLVAKVRQSTEQLKRDTARLQQIRARRIYAEEGEPHQGTGAAPGPDLWGMEQAISPGSGYSPSVGGSGAGAAQAQAAFDRMSARYAADGGLPDATQHNPEMSGTDEDLRGDFESVQPDKKETNPKDAALHQSAWNHFDSWLRQVTGRTASQHNANFIRRQASRWAQANNVSVEILFPTLRNVLREARKAERSGTMYRTADEKLEVAAPQDRIDVEKPVRDTTDEEAQASQFDEQAFGNNAGDNIADPDLDTGSQIWAPGEGRKESKKADAVAAVRCAEAYIKAGLTPEDEKWKLIAQFQTMRHATVVDRTRLLEAVLQSASSRRVTAGVQRGTVPRSSIPPGFTSGSRRVASQTRTAANDPTFDCTLYV